MTIFASLHTSQLLVFPITTTTTTTTITKHRYPEIFAPKLTSYTFCQSHQFRSFYPIQLILHLFCMTYAKVLGVISLKLTIKSPRENNFYHYISKSTPVAKVHTSGRSPHRWQKSTQVAEAHTSGRSPHQWQKPTSVAEVHTSGRSPHQW